MNTVKLINACKKIGSGATPRGGNESYKPSGISLIRSQNIYNDGFKRDGLAFIDDEQAKDLENVIIEPDDVLLNITGDSVARCCQVPENILPARVNQHVAIIRPNPNELDARYLRYYLIMPTTQDYLHALASAGATRPALTKGMIESLEVPTHPLPEQRAIAKILGALDDKIELNRCMNATLESMARTVFRKWFVKNIEIDNWEIETLGDVLTVLETGSRPKGGVTQEPVGIPSVGAESIVKIGSFDFSKTKYISNEFYESMRRGHIEDRDVLLYKDGGRPGEFEPHVSMFGDGFPFKKFSINEHVYRMRVAPPFSQAYFYFWLESDEIMEEMRSRGTGVAIPGLNSTALSGISISIPPEKLLNDFSNYVEPLISKIFANAKESRTLASLRDSLLPKLMRGEVRVK